MPVDSAEAKVPRAEQVADDRVAIAVATTASGQALAALLRELPGCLEAVGGIATVECQFDLALVSARDFLAAVDAAISAASWEPVRPGRVLDVPVAYGDAAGPDLDSVCRALDLTRTEFVRRHTGREYKVAMLGFTPGFAYLDGMAESLACPRRDTPRQWVAAGSVGIAGHRSGLYALAGPGGWQIIGRTNLELFDPSAANPFRLGAGDRIRFVAADA